MDVIRSNPGAGTNQIVRLSAMKRQRVAETLRMLADEGRVVMGGSEVAHEWRLPSDDPGFTAQDLLAEKRAAQEDPETHEHNAPLGYKLRGVSTLLNASGKQVMTWVKTAKSFEAPEAILDAFCDAVSGRTMPAAPLVTPLSVGHVQDLMTVYPMGDPHLGMLAWHAETGEDFDLRIAEQHLCAAVDRLVALAPPSEQALIIDLGDFIHADSLDAVTRASGHHLDVDSRWSKVMRVGVLAMTRCIDRSLEKHLKVHVIIEIGNHNDHSALMMSICLSHYYRDNPRVYVDTSPSPFHWFEFGKNLIGVTHGHNTKPAALPGIMAHDKAEAWGRTRQRYWYVGHVHHESKKEFPGCIVESFRTLAARDYWHHSKGYRAGRSMVCDVLHVEHGRILRHEVGVEALR